MYRSVHLTLHRPNRIGSSFLWSYFSTVRCYSTIECGVPAPRQTGQQMRFQCGIPRWVLDNQSPGHNKNSRRRESPKHLMNTRLGSSAPEEGVSPVGWTMDAWLDRAISALLPLKERGSTHGWDWANNSVQATFRGPIPGLARAIKQLLQLQLV